VGKSSTLLSALHDCQTFDDFLNRTSNLNKKVVEALILSGALDKFKKPRRGMLNAFNLLGSFTDKELDWVKTSNMGFAPSITAMASEDTVEERKARKEFVPNVRRRGKIREIIEEYAKLDHHDIMADLLAWEEEYLGISFSGNLADLAPNDFSLSCIDIAKGQFNKNAPIFLCVTVVGVREHIISKGKMAGEKMAFLKVSDSSFMLDNVVMFPSTYEKRPCAGDVIKFKGALSDRGSVIINFFEKVS
jgi:DNA polymerase III alpha subunit